MSDRLPLPSHQLAALQDAMTERESTIISGVLQQPDYPPLAACPSCGHAPEQITSKAEAPRYGVYEDAVLVDFAPCGHKFRAVISLEVP